MICTGQSFICNRRRIWVSNDDNLSFTLPLSRPISSLNSGDQLWLVNLLYRNIFWIMKLGCPFSGKLQKRVLAFRTSFFFTMLMSIFLRFLLVFRVWTMIRTLLIHAWVNVFIQQFYLLECMSLGNHRMDCEGFSGRNYFSMVCSFRCWIYLRNLWVGPSLKLLWKVHWIWKARFSLLRVFPREEFWSLGSIEIIF